VTAYTDEEPRSSVALPHTVLEGGGETIEVLLAAVTRSIEEMVSGQVLHVVSAQPLAGSSLVAWCKAMGHELLDTLVDGEEDQCWIRKG
jgi:TusA-related sulfurtransferase